MITYKFLSNKFAQNKFGSAFRLSDIDNEVQQSVLNGTRAVAKLSETGVVARIKSGFSRVPIVLLS